MSGRILPNSNVIEVRQGDSFTIKLHIKKNDKYIDLSGAELRMQARDNKDRVVLDILGESINVVEGKMAILITPENSNIEIGDYNCDIQLKTSDGSINTIFPANVNQIGILRITKQVTR